ncbi:hypothetical protein NEISUBOT_05398 [Neisseria subflava NJ9703]|uniref:Uncharacterized protein n=1 Tax=Neisseria subflava NJ9703 TaxID=546268 RepID=A0A9W5IPB9_NEISU|nr:hypothetical protein NEISUBOT_05398 [Neisseria subflava NJ9703]
MSATQAKFSKCKILSSSPHTNKICRQFISKLQKYFEQSEGTVPE